MAATGLVGVIYPAINPPPRWPKRVCGTRIAVFATTDSGLRAKDICRALTQLLPRTMTIGQ
jgi:hypothetical protein